ncbi:MAG: alpha/beta hydrolase, partial [Clostridium sp.]|nr:alpha/beta hydrolase [Clostridium sp.]
ERSMLKNAAMELIRLGKKNIGQTYLKLLYQTTNYTDINRLLMKSLEALGADADNIMWHGKDKKVIEKIAKQRDGGKELIQKSNKTRFKLLSDYRVYHDVFEELSKVNKPSLLIKGKYDPITSKKQIKEFIFNEAGGNTAERKVVRFDHSSHWARIEESDKYCDVVTDFILGHK